MLRRLLLFAIASLISTFGLPNMAAAVEIDQDLRERLAAKETGATVPVLMIFDQPNQVAPDRLAKLNQATLTQHRAAMITVLKQQAQVTHSGAAAILTDPGQQSRVDNIRYLYLANAITFEADWSVVQELGSLPDAATLFFDRTYDLTAATDRGVSSAVPKSRTAATDTVWSAKYINADRVWRELGYTGDGVVVGHIDTGVWLAHPDLVNRLWVNAGEIPDNGIDDDDNGFVDDVNGWDFGMDDNDPNDEGPGTGHGTHTAGTVAGDGSGGTLTGTAPGATIMALKVWQADGSGGSLGMIWAAEQYAVENGARILTLSLAIAGTIPETFMRAERSNDANIRDLGVTIFNASGNDHFAFEPPLELGLMARVPAPWNALSVPHSSTGGVITVGGTGHKNNEAYARSSQGPAKWDDIRPWQDWPYNPGLGLTKPDIGAPGVRVNSTVVGGGYSGDTWSGTSMACPHAAGVAALMLERNPSLSPAGIDSLMELNALDFGVPGKDNLFGSGRIDAYAIVSATPLTQNPDLVWTAVLPDLSGDGVLDAGSVSEVAIELVNAGGHVDATELTASLAIVANEYVTVVDASGDFGNLSAGGTGNNSGDPFSLSVAADAPQGFEFTLLVTVSANGTFERTFDIPWFVGLPEWRTHDQGGMFLTVTDQGIIGYMSQDQNMGGGMGYQDSRSGIFVGSFWAGTDVTYICNRDYGGLGTENFEWEVSDPSPNGRVRKLSGTKADEAFTATFTDAGHAQPKPLIVEQVSMAYRSPRNNQFVILEYSLTNEGSEALPALYNGIFCDLDLGEDTNVNLGGTDATRNLSYLYDDGDTYMGIALLGSNPAQNVTVISNETYVYQTSAIDDDAKMKHLRGLISEPIGDVAGDWSALTSSVVSLDADGGQAVVAYALVVGANLAEIQAAVDAANMAYGNSGPNPEVPEIFRLAQNTPNPFNPGTEIRFTVAVAGHVKLAVYDLKGRLVRTLVNENRPAGAQTPVVWNGRDDAGQAMPSGIYFSRFVSGGQSTSRKMMLIR